ncbi:response regulator transcription factor [Actinokineospora sp. G85]|uniref:response regulator transcription factor n=1 Tax=Actinokineospora sp. G85 TaxID=3406626 RepID=UPI003C752A18
MARPLPAWLSPPPAWRVLVVENNDTERFQLKQGLSRHGHRVEAVGTGAQALRACANADLVLLELELADLDGLEVCRAIQLTSGLPVIVTTARSSELDCVLALQAGADDYLVKPYGFRELVARMDAVMRRAAPRARDERVLEHGALRIDTDKREVHLANRRVPLSRKEFDLLHMLASHPDSVVPRERIMRQVWENSWSRRTVDTHVSSIRAKLGSNSWILTVRGVGFRIGHA